MPMVKFTPSPEQREVVTALSAAKMPLEKIAASIINPRTQRAISVKTLGKLFKDQLDAGVGSIVEAYRGLRAALEAKEAWAIKYVFDHLAEFKAKEREITTPTAVKEEIQNVNVAFVTAKGLADEPESPREPTFVPPPPRLLPNLTMVPNPPEPPPKSAAAMENKYPYFEEEPPPQPLPTNGPPHIGKYRVETDDPDNPYADNTNWHKKKLTGRLPQGPIMGAKRPKGWMG